MNLRSGGDADTLYVGMHEPNGPAHESEVTRNGYVPGGRNGTVHDSACPDRWREGSLRTRATASKD